MSGQALLRRGVLLEQLTLGWNVVGVVVLAVAAVRAGSVALAGFGLDSLIEIAASAVVIWHLTGAARLQEPAALRLIGSAFLALAVYVAAQAAASLLLQSTPDPSGLGIAWTAATVAAMLLLAEGKRRTGAALGNRVLLTESRVTGVDAALAAVVVVGLVLNAAVGWWWADPVSGIAIAAYALREGRAALAEARGLRV
ncbi:MAG TPA: hypothetical protein PKD59_13130 [Miltoncostaeaceae bacterium]|nr:hypothetical protein [Miltoncostaeaceae bacterium]